ncbi:hypothetical protein [Halobacillus amylolyticus]|uniref:Uncharacterized protein n=1 Tax=Halobacillus amylolyticus TaxID=2932259 RepID=A0ABY4H940_9BACI|nr:hypothetical protein [Halobacillus amylolyticus]UOR11394.1 hypothetical protein MUO15_17630 [Halobacillus amylolyticus]
MELKNVFKTVGVGVLSMGVLAGCASEETSSEEEYLTDSDVEQFYTEEELNTWAEENGLLDEGSNGNAGADAEEPDLDEEPSEGNGNAGADAEEPDLDEEPSENSSS